MRSADNGSHVSFIHVSPSSLTGNLIGEGEAHVKSRNRFEHEKRLVLTRRSRVYVASRNERRFICRSLGSP